MLLSWKLNFRHNNPHGAERTVIKSTLDTMMLGLLVISLLFFGEFFSRMFNVQRNEVTDPARVSFFGGYDQPQWAVAFGEWTTVAAIREEHKALLKAWIKLR
jgi:hypothetical protein